MKKLKLLKRRSVVRIGARLVRKVKIAAERDGRPVSGYVRALTDAVARAESRP